jgi:hypothetical protein
VCPVLPYARADIPLNGKPTFLTKHVKHTTCGTRHTDPLFFDRISGSPIVTLSPNGRVSRKQDAGATHSAAHAVGVRGLLTPMPDLASLNSELSEQEDATSSETKTALAEAAVVEEEEASLPHEHDERSLATTAARRQDKTAAPDQAPDEAPEGCSEQSESCVRSHSDKEVDTWWECDYCSRAFASLDEASEHEESCCANKSKTASINTPGGQEKVRRN